MFRARIGFVLLLATTALAAFLALAGPGASPATARRELVAGERDTSRAYPFYRRGLAFYAEGRTIEALRQFQNATFFDPEGAELRFAQASACSSSTSPPRRGRNSSARWRALPAMPGPTTTWVSPSPPSATRPKPAGT